MPKLEIYTLRGTILDTIPCCSGETVKELVKNAMESKKLRIEEARCLKQQKKDGTWTKIRWKDKVGDDDAVYRITRDPQKLLLKHRVRVVDFNGEEIGRFPTRCGKSVLNIVNDVCRQLQIEKERVLSTEIRIGNGFKRVPKDSMVNFNDVVVIIVDELERDHIRIENGEPVLPRCLSVLKLVDLLREYKHSNRGKEPRGKTINVEEFIKKLESGKRVDEAEKYLISRSVVDPLCEHCLRRGSPWRNESRLYLNNLFAPYPQLHVDEFVSPIDRNLEKDPFDNVLSNRLFVSLRHRRASLKRISKENFRNK
uniref:Ubiquitin-like domain-containing protein n=1 Tax=Bursaphelenchus xylophilus TaxID=6326 RepID=A0A1I7RVH6_BURXY